MTNDDLKLNGVQYDICDTQGRIFEIVAKRYSPDSFKIFVEKYMRSDFCRRQMDSSYSSFQVHDPEESLDFVIPEIEKTTKLYSSLDQQFLPDAAYWIGFVYRQISMKTCLNSSDIIKAIPLRRMIAMYPGMHTLDETMIIETIMQEFGLPFHDKKV